MPVIPFVQNPIFAPVINGITAITNAVAAQVTTSSPHGYLDGAIIRLHIPTGFGMTQANELFGSIIVTGPTTFTISIDTTAFDPFVVPSPNVAPAQTIPIGENNNTLASSFRNILMPLF